MKKITAILVTVMMVICFIAFTHQESLAAPKLQKWQEAVIVNEIGKELKTKYASLNVKMIDRGDIEFFYKATGHSLDGLIDYHTYFGCLPVVNEWHKDKPVAETKRRAYFIITFHEYLADIPEIDVNTMMPIKKGFIKKGKFALVVDYDGEIGVSKEEIDFRKKQIAVCKEVTRKYFRKFEEE